MVIHNFKSYLPLQLIYLIAPVISKQCLKLRCLTFWAPLMLAKRHILHFGVSRTWKGTHMSQPKWLKLDISAQTTFGSGLESAPLACIGICSVSSLTVNLGWSIFYLYLQPVTRLSLQFISLKCTLPRSLSRSIISRISPTLPLIAP